MELHKVKKETKAKDICSATWQCGLNDKQADPIDSNPTSRSSKLHRRKSSPASCRRLIPTATAMMIRTINNTVPAKACSCQQ